MLNTNNVKIKSKVIRNDTGSRGKFIYPMTKLHELYMNCFSIVICNPKGAIQKICHAWINNLLGFD